MFVNIIMIMTSYQSVNIDLSFIAYILITIYIHHPLLYFYIRRIYLYAYGIISLTVQGRLFLPAWLATRPA